MNSQTSLDSQLLPAAEVVTSDPLDRFPPLIIYTCLTSATPVLVDAARTVLKMGNPAVTEKMSMPRDRFGSRPAEIMAPVSRTLYTALVNHLGGALAEPTRQDGAWSDFRRFGRTGDHSYVVEMDLTSCYEFIDHADLTQELLLRSFDQTTTAALTGLLKGVGRRGRGLPQMLEPSDQLADTYLSMIDRALMRQGWESRRFADDFRVLANDWDQANEIIEFASSLARSIGMVLSTAKTVIVRRETFEVQAATDDQALQERLQQDPWVDVDDYHGVGAHTDGPANVAEAGYELIAAWHAGRNADGTSTTGDERLLGRALNAAIDHEVPVDSAALNDIVFVTPPRLENVCQYLLSRDDQSDYRNEALRVLTTSVRRSPWAKLWILHVADSAAEIDPDVLTWAHRQIEDQHEVVRAQAAWTLAGSGQLIDEALRKVYARATEISAPALAAAGARQNGNGPLLQSTTVNGIKDDGPLNKEAYRWAK